MLRRQPDKRLEPERRIDRADERRQDAKAHGDEEYARSERRDEPAESRDAEG